MPCYSVVDLPLWPRIGSYVGFVIEMIKGIKVGGYRGWNVDVMSLSRCCLIAY